MYDSDLQLVAACRLGDQLAWEKLVRRYQRLIYAIPRRSGLSEDQAAEIFQDVFTTLFEKLNDIEDPDKLQAWLVTTTRRRTLRTISRTPAKPHPDDDPDLDAKIAESIRDQSLLPDEQLMMLEEQQRVRLAVSQLDERCQKLVQLLFYQPEPPSYAEVAKVLGIPEGSIGPTRARCLGKLLRLLTKWDSMYFLLVGTLC